MLPFQAIDFWFWPIFFWVRKKNRSADLNSTCQSLLTDINLWPFYSTKISTHTHSCFLAFSLCYLFRGYLFLYSGNTTNSTRSIAREHCTYLGVSYLRCASEHLWEAQKLNRKGLWTIVAMSMSIIIELFRACWKIKNCLIYD